MFDKPVAFAVPLRRAIAAASAIMALRARAVAAIAQITSLGVVRHSSHDRHPKN
jgi:hypothetical protein